jgi:MFS family permease
MWQCFSRVCVINIHSLSLTKFVLVTAIVQGIFGCLTATFWGSVRALTNPSLCIRPETFKFSDRYGRVKFLGLNIITLLLDDAALAALAVAPDYVPGGYWLLLFTSAFEGLIGGRCRPRSSTTSNVTLLYCRTFCGHCSPPSVSCGLQ